MNIKHPEFALIVIQECINSGQKQRHNIESLETALKDGSVEFLSEEFMIELYGENYKDPNKKEMDLLNWWWNEIFPKLKVFDGVFKEDFEKIPNDINRYLDYLYTLKDRFKNPKKDEEFAFNKEGFFSWRGEKKKLSAKAENYLKELLNAPGFEKKDIKDADKYRTIDRECAVKCLIDKFKVSRELVNNILRYNKTKHWIDRENVKTEF